MNSNSQYLKLEQIILVKLKNLTKIVKPEEIFITNIQSTHLENFKSKKNIAKEKSRYFQIPNITIKKKIIFKY